MAGLALVPLAGLIWFAAQEIAEAREHRDYASTVAEAADRAVALVQLEAAVADEKHWTHALNGLADISVDIDVIVDVIGIDLRAEQSDAIARVDRWLAALGSSEFRTPLLQIRHDATSSTVDITADFSRYQEGLEALLRTEIDRLVRTAATLPDGAMLVDAARVLETAAELRSDMAWQLGSYFGSRFTIDRTPAEETRNLIDRTERYTANLARLDRLTEGDSRTRVVLLQIQQSVTIASFQDVLDSLIDNALSEGLDGLGAPDISAEVENPLIIAETFTLAVAATDEHLPLVTAAALDVSGLAEDARLHTERTLVVALALGAALCILSAAAALAATRVIVVPLRRVSHVAEAMRRGSLESNVDEGGPREIQSTARAMNEAIEQLKLVERQALALAEGDIDNPALEMETPGLLGASLRRAVSQLTESLTEREEFRRRLAHEATHDGLTGLANRRASIAHLGQALARSKRSTETLAVLFVDLDGFKAINDIHGHPVGDRILVQIGQRLGLTIREGDLAGRLGGDEFIIVAEPVHGIDDVLQLAERVSLAVSQPIRAGGITVTARCSIGIALAGDGAETAEELIHDADLAVYEAKRTGRARIEVCTEDLRAQVAQRGDVERSLAAAIEGHELELYFQTVVGTATGEPESVEALVRWHHPDRGLVTPDVFVTVAERTDLILDLDRWVLAEAARHLAAWQHDPVLTNLALAVNLSGRHLSQPDLADQVLGPLRTHNVNPNRLIVEVTESALLDDLESAAAQLSVLREAGVRIAIDDFGTGYTSLTHLRSLPVDILKIDRSYNDNLAHDEDRALVRLIIDTGHLLGLKITAEGIERFDQVVHLRELGADCLQGFHYSYPVAHPTLLEQLSPASEPAGPLSEEPAGA